MDIQKYESIAERYNSGHFLTISPQQIVFDIRAILKCRWGCDFSKNKGIRCETHNLSVEERREIIHSYHNIILLHNHDAKALTHACLDIEKELFFDGYYFAFTLRTCNYCDNCNVQKGLDCPYPEKVRPCEEMFGIDVYKTVKNLGLPIEVLKSKDEMQNRYGFVLID
jgi:predicted metal-binding protein